MSEVGQLQLPTNITCLFVILRTLILFAGPFENQSLVFPSRLGSDFCGGQGRCQNKSDSPIRNIAKNLSKDQPRDFPGGPVVKNPSCNAEDLGLVPGLGTKIPHAAGRLKSLCTAAKNSA